MPSSVPPLPHPIGVGEFSSICDRFTTASNAGFSRDVVDADFDIFVSGYESIHQFSEGLTRASELVVGTDGHGRNADEDDVACISATEQAMSRDRSLSAAQKSLDVCQAHPSILHLRKRHESEASAGGEWG